LACFWWKSLGGEYFADVPWSAAKRCAATGPAQLFRLTKQTHQQVWSQKIVHRRLGGLTTGSATIMWSGVDGHLVRLRDEVYPKRPLTKFADIAADLPRGTTRRQMKDTLPARDSISLAAPGMASDCSSPVCFRKRRIGSSFSLC
jgi:hypothetical protein